MEDTAAQTTYCVNHPTVETALRCNQCGDYICARCAVHTPTGYRCRTCIKSHQKVYDTSKPMDGVFAVVVAGVLSFLGSLLVGVAGYLSIFLAPLAGVVIGVAVRLVTQKRRSQATFRMTLIATAVGALPLFVFNLIGALLLAQTSAGIWPLLTSLYYAYYAVVAAMTAHYRVSGQIFRFRR
jgi:hypothetical protein